MGTGMATRTITATTATIIATHGIATRRNFEASPLPAALVRRRIGRVLCREGRRGTKADVCLLRGEGGAEIGRQATQQKRSASNRSERGEATGAVAEGLMGDSAASPLTAPFTSAAIGSEGLRPCGTRRHQAPER